MHSIHDMTWQASKSSGRCLAIQQGMVVICSRVAYLTTNQTSVLPQARKQHDVQDSGHLWRATERWAPQMQGMPRAFRRAKRQRSPLSSLPGHARQRTLMTKSIDEIGWHIGIINSSSQAGEELLLMTLTLAVWYNSQGSIYSKHSITDTFIPSCAGHSRSLLQVLL